MSGVGPPPLSNRFGSRNRVPAFQYRIVQPNKWKATTIEPFGMTAKSGEKRILAIPCDQSSNVNVNGNQSMMESTHDGEHQCHSVDSQMSNELIDSPNREIP